MFTIGADPEVFLRRKTTRKLVSAYDLFPGTKASPHRVPHGAIQVDGMAAEINIDPVAFENNAGAFGEFDNNIQEVLNNLKDRLPEYSLVLDPVADFGKEYIDEQPEKARELGCDPDFNAYTLQPNPRPDGDRPFRTAAGHIHVGWGDDIPVEDPEHMKICSSFVKFLDATVGVFMTLIEEPNERRELYGKAGAFRPKSYGVEYRTPSNVWLRNRARRRAIFALVKQAVALRRTNSLDRHCTEAQLQKAINGADRTLAASILRQTTPYWIEHAIGESIGDKGLYPY